MERNFKGIWIPAEIWLCTDLTMQEKIFLVEIDSLDNENGCYANNQYFSNFFGISKTRVSLVLQGLINKGYIKTNLIYKKNSKQILNRIININRPPYPTKVIEGIQQKLNTPTQQKLNTPTQQKLKDNNIYNNNIYNNICPSGNETKYKNEKSKLETNENEEYQLIEPLVYQVSTSGVHRIEENRIEEIKKDKKSSSLDEQESKSLQDFELIWEIYPRKEAKASAFKNYCTLLKGKKILGKIVKLTNKEIWLATNNYSESVQGYDKKYIKLGSTFYNTSVFDYLDD